MKKILTIFGTRPEAIKLAPIVHELEKYPDKFDSIVGVTGQHDTLLKQVLDIFEIRPRFNLNVMRDNQDLEELTASIIERFGKILNEIRPDIVLVQGDTTTVFAASLAAFYQKISIGHVEAGMRTGDKYNPFPEEINRCLTDQLSDLFFVPTDNNRQNLLKEGIAKEKIFITGNTVIDALQHIVSSDRYAQLNPVQYPENKTILLTAHRRENFGTPLKNIFHAVAELADKYESFQFVFPVHPNPNVTGPANRILSGRRNIHLISPLDYLSFIQLMDRSFIILSDSGGIQEEAPSLNKPVLILREKTERTEIVDAGGAILVGTDKETIIKEFSRLITDYDHYKKMTNIENPYGKGDASRQITNILDDYLNGKGYQTGQDNTDLLLKQGEDYFHSCNISDAENCFKKVLNYDPNHLEALNNIGVIAFHKSEYGSALSYFQRALAIDERHTDAIENCSKCLIAVKEPLTALNLIQKSFKLGIINTDLLNMMGQCFMELKDMRSAKSVFEKSLSLNPDQEEIKKLIDAIKGVPKDNGGFNRHSASIERLNIGFISIWFERGQSYVTKALRDILSNEHNTFVFARTGGVFGQPKLEKSGYWDVPNLTTYPEYKIPTDVIKKWVTDNKLHVVIFNEEYDWDLVRGVKETGAKVITYLDYYKDDWKTDIDIYDSVLCSTNRTYNLVKSLCKAHYIGWCVDLDLFKPVNDDSLKKHTFFHNAGWLGINYRKMTPAVILAFNALSRAFENSSLLVHAQADLDKLPPQIIDIIKSNDRINYHIETVPAPGLYHRGEILVFPSKLEGLGLPLPEGLACGLPAIVTNAPPMNEFIKNGYNGFLVRVAHRISRHDNISFPEEIIDVNDLVLKMSEAIKNPDLINEMGINARRFAENELNPKVLGNRLNDLFYEIMN